METTGSDSSTERDKVSNQLQFLPFSFIYGGDYNRGSGNINGHNVRSSLWESVAYYSSNARILYFYSAGLRTQEAYNKGYGYSIRCLVR